MQNEIEKLISKKSNSGNAVANIFYNLMTNCNLSYSDILNMPVPLAFELLKIVSEENKRMEKEMKKKK